MTPCFGSPMWLWISSIFCCYKRNVAAFLIDFDSICFLVKKDQTLWDRLTSNFHCQCIEIVLYFCNNFIFREKKTHLLETKSRTPPWMILNESRNKIAVIHTKIIMAKITVTLKMLHKIGVQLCHIHFTVWFLSVKCDGISCNSQKYLGLKQRYSHAAKIQFFDKMKIFGWLFHMYVAKCGIW